MNREKGKYRGPICLLLAAALFWPLRAFPEERNDPAPMRLDIRGVLSRFMDANSDVRTALIEYGGAGEALLRDGAKYDTQLVAGAEGGRSIAYNMFTRSGDGVGSARGYGGVEQRLATGTTLRATVNGTYTVMPSTRIAVGGENFEFGGNVYNAQVRVEIAQELLKNSFGRDDRLEKKSAGYGAQIGETLVRARLAALVADAVQSCYELSDARAALDAVRADIQSTTGIRDILILKVNQGLAGPEEAHEWNCRLSQARMAAASSTRRLEETRGALLRMLGYPPDGGIELVDSPGVKPPDVALESALRDAFARRSDWLAQRLAVDRAQAGLQIASGGMLPSLTLKLGAAGNGYDPSSGYAALPQGRRDLEYFVGAEMRYPLGGTDSRADEERAGRNLETERESLKKMERAIRDEVAGRIRDCAAAYQMYRDATDAREFARAHYAEIYLQFQRGRIQSTGLKLALDTFTRAEYTQSRALLDYNRALLMRDLARNTFLEDLGVDLDALLKRAGRE